MKLMKTARILGIALIVSLLAAAIPVAPALGADNEFDLSPTSGKIGDTITITGDDFIDEFYFLFCFSDENASEGEEIGDDVTDYTTIASGYSDDEGEFSDTFEVPDELSVGNEDVTPGTYYVYATINSSGDQLIVGKATFTVEAAGEISIDPDEGIVGDEVEIEGESFADDEEITIEFDGEEVDIEGDDETDNDGEFVSYILIPESTAGDHDIDVIVAGATVTAEFTVESDIVISPQSGQAGDFISISGTGFARRDYITVYFANHDYAQSVRTDTYGSFYLASFEIPDLGLSQGTYNIEVEDEAENLALTPFTLNTITPTTTPPTTATTTTPPTATTTPTGTASLNTFFQTNYVGSLVYISGTGFTPNDTATVLFGGTARQQVTIDPNGFFSTSINVPTVSNGIYIIEVIDSHSISGTAEFNVATTAPPVPTPSEPRMGAKAKSPVSFDWEDVTDASTYTLEVSTDSTFAEGSLVLTKSLLETSEYLMTEQEALDLATETLYYWRVQAVDAASNAGAWSGVGEFYVSPPFNFPTWAIIVLSIFGAILFFGLGYWLGRRTAFFY